MQWIKAYKQKPETNEVYWRRASDKSGLDLYLMYDFTPNGILYGEKVIAYSELEWLDESTPATPTEAKEIIDDYVRRQGTHDRPDITRHDFTQGFLSGISYGTVHDSGPIPSSIVRRLEEANPFEKDITFDEKVVSPKHAAWQACVSKLRKLLSQQPVQGNAEVLVKALQHLEKMHGYEFVTEALASYNTGKGDQEVKK